jgi:hypothetical protein
MSEIIRLASTGVGGLLLTRPRSWAIAPITGCSFSPRIRNNEANYPLHKIPSAGPKNSANPRSNCYQPLEMVASEKDRLSAVFGFGGTLKFRLSESSTLPCDGRPRSPRSRSQASPSAAKPRYWKKPRSVLTDVADVKGAIVHHHVSAWEVFF